MTPDIEHPASFLLPINKKNLGVEMNVEGFVIANGVSTTTLNMLKDCFDACKPVDDFIHEKLLAMFFCIFYCIFDCSMMIKLNRQMWRIDIKYRY